MTRAEMIELKDAIAGHVLKCGATIEETDILTPQQERLITTFERMHAVICRELQIGRPAWRAELLEKAMRLATIQLAAFMRDDGDSRRVKEALCILDNALQEETDHGS